MKDANTILEEVNDLNAEAARLREEFKAKAVRLADAVVRNRHESGKLIEMFFNLINDYMEADDRYSAAVNEATDACERLKKCVLSSR